MSTPHNPSPRRLSMPEPHTAENDAGKIDVPQAAFDALREPGPGNYKAARSAEKDAGLRDRLMALADSWTKGLDIDGVPATATERRIIADVRDQLSGGWECTPDCERAYGGVHHGCTYVRATRHLSPGGSDV